MKLGIMQPYFVPYIGYWQLLNAVDKYVIYDDVNFIKGGWINRNRILMNGEPRYFNLPMLGASPNKLINQIAVNQDGKFRSKNIQIIKDAYKKAPYFLQVFPVIEQILLCEKTNLAENIAESIRIICDYLGIQTEILISSSLQKDCSLKGQDKVISICNLLGATEYYNAIGGQDLYSFSDFEKEGIQLRFLKTEPMEYVQFGNSFHSNLSIIDVMMFNAKEEIREMLQKYILIDAASCE